MRYAKPARVDEALRLLEEGTWRILAGGTDFYPAQGDRPIRDAILDINGLDGLRGIATEDDHVVIGAGTTWSDVLRAELPPAFDALKLAAREVGSVQIQNTGTVAGNLCNASPAADGVPPLLCLDAEVELRSAGGLRRLPLAGFLRGNRTTAITRQELLTAIRVPRTAVAGRSAFLKLGARRYLVISIAMASARIAIDRDGRVADSAVAVGACSAVAQRLPALEAALNGQPADGSLPAIVAEHHLGGLSPIDDVRGSAAYRRAAAVEIVRRAVEAAISAEPLRSAAA